MKYEWKTKTLGELTSYISKGIPPKYTNNYSNSTIIVLNQKCNRNFKISYEYARFHDLSQKKVPHEKILKNGDILINSTGTGTAGRIAQINNINQPVTIDGHMILMRPTKEVDNLYYGYALKSQQKQIELFAEGSTGQTEINKQRLINEILITYPSDIKIQHYISSILSALDDKIELNNKINENLEMQAQAIFKSWFVDFEPFGGVMPEDWKMGTVKDIVELHDSKRIPLSGSEREKMDKIYPYYGATSCMDYVDNYIFDGIYLLLGEDGTVVDTKGFPILQYVEGKFWVNNHAHILTGKLGYTVETLYLLFKQTNVTHIVTGAVQPKISQTNLKKLPAIIPNIKELDNFNTIIQPIFSMIRKNKKENQRLAELRDTLLPKLMNGEIDVDDVQF